MANCSVSSDRPMRPTSADVARASGVSRATVSFVLNSAPGSRISAATRDRVLAVAEELGYVPNAPAQALAGGQSSIVVIDLSDLPYGQPLAAAAREMASALQQAGLIPIVDQLTAGRGDHSLLLALARTVVPMAVITITPLPTEVQARLLEAGVRQLIHVFPTETAALTDIARATAVQVQYLVDSGHRTIAFAHPDDPAQAPIVAARSRAARQAASDRDAVIVVDFSVRSDGMSPAELRTLQEAHAFTAVAAFFDDTAVAVLAAAARAGIDVPNDLAVIGVDDIPLAQLLVPSLTTVRRDPSRAHGFDGLADAIRLGTAPAAAVSSPSIVVQRQSA